LVDASRKIELYLACHQGMSVEGKNRGGKNKEHRLRRKGQPPFQLLADSYRLNVREGNWPRRKKKVAGSKKKPNILTMDLFHREGGRRTYRRLGKTDELWQVQ